MTFLQTNILLIQQYTAIFLIPSFKPLKKWFLIPFSWFSVTLVLLNTILWKKKFRFSYFPSNNGKFICTYSITSNIESSESIKRFIHWEFLKTCQMYTVQNFAPNLSLDEFYFVLISKIYPFLIVNQQNLKISIFWNIVFTCESFQKFFPAFNIKLILFYPKLDHNSKNEWT